MTTMSVVICSVAALATAPLTCDKSAVDFPVVLQDGTVVQCVDKANDVTWIDSLPGLYETLYGRNYSGGQIEVTCYDVNVKRQIP